jgi:ElaB/YqjD/DUF883 family membrane-anchored ribosome-binding protein
MSGRWIWARWLKSEGDQDAGMKSAACFVRPAKESRSSRSAWVEINKRGLRGFKQANDTSKELQMGLFTRSTLDSNINGAAKVGHRAVQGASDAVDTASTQLRGLLDDLDSSIRDAKDIDVDKLRKDLQAKLKTARAQFDGSSSAIAGRLNDAADYADEFVHDKPWHTLGAVAGLALLVGFLAGRS